MAATTTPRAINGHRIAFLETSDTVSKLRNPSSIFMAEGECASEAQTFLDHVQVGMAHARATDFYQDLAGAGRRLGNISELSRMAGAK